MSPGEHDREPADDRKEENGRAEQATLATDGRHLSLSNGKA